MGLINLDFAVCQTTCRTMCVCEPCLWLLERLYDRYDGTREETNMVIINIRLLSGFKLEETSLLAVSDTWRALVLFWTQVLQAVFDSLSIPPFSVSTAEGRPHRQTSGSGRGSCHCIFGWGERIRFIQIPWGAWNIFGMDCWYWHYIHCNSDEIKIDLVLRTITFLHICFSS